MVYPWSTHGLPMSYRGLHMGYPWATHGPPLESWATRGRLMGDPWASTKYHGLPKGDPWIRHIWFPKGNLCTTHNLPTAHGQPMPDAWPTHGQPIWATHE